MSRLSGLRHASCLVFNLKHTFWLALIRQLADYGAAGMFQDYICFISAKNDCHTEVLEV